MSKKLNISVNSWGRFEDGDSATIKSSILAELVEWGFDANWILTGEGEMFLPDTNDGLLMEQYQNIMKDVALTVLNYIQENNLDLENEKIVKIIELMTAEQIETDSEIIHSKIEELIKLAV